MRWSIPGYQESSKPGQRRDSETHPASLYSGKSSYVPPVFLAYLLISIILVWILGFAVEYMI